MKINAIARSIRPAFGRVVIRPDVPADIAPLVEVGGEVRAIELPDDVKDRESEPITGVVVSVGAPDPVYGACEWQEGERVLFGRYGGTEVQLESGKVLVMRFKDIEGVLE